MKRKCRIEIGNRAYHELLRVFPEKSISEISLLLGCNRKLPFAWRDGCAPSPMFLERMAQLGADVHYILTGNRTFSGFTESEYCSHENVLKLAKSKNRSDSPCDKCTICEFPQQCTKADCAAWRDWFPRAWDRARVAVLMAALSQGDAR